jgi:hypothetical protein
MKTLLLVALGCLFPVLPCGAQDQRVDPVERFRVEPILAQYYADKLGLTADQRSFIAEQLRDARQHFEVMQLELQREMRATETLLDGAAPDEGQLLAQLDRVLEVERRIKRLNLVCALRVRRHLTPAQVTLLRQQKVPPPPPPPRPTTGSASRRPDAPR